MEKAVKDIQAKADQIYNKFKSNFAFQVTLNNPLTLWHELSRRVTRHFGSSLSLKCQSSKWKQQAWRSPRWYILPSYKILTFCPTRCWAWSETQRDHWATPTPSLMMKTCRKEWRILATHSSNISQEILMLQNCIKVAFIVNNPVRWDSRLASRSSELESVTSSPMSS